MQGHVDLVHVLLDAGADLDVVNSAGKTAIDIATEQEKVHKLRP